MGQIGNPPPGMSADTFQKLKEDCYRNNASDGARASCYQAIWTNAGKGVTQTPSGVPMIATPYPGTFPYKSPSMTIPGYYPQTGKGPIKFDPNVRKIIVLLVAGTLLVAAFVSVR